MQVEEIEIEIGDEKDQELIIDLDDDEEAIKIRNSNAIVRMEENVIESISVNGTDIPPDENKNVDITVPTETNDLINNGDGSSPFATEHYVDVDSKAFKPYPEEFDTSHTTMNFLNSIEALNLDAGMAYLGGVTLTDMPFIGNAEAEVYIYPNNIIYLILRSANVSPYEWECNNHTFRGWEAVGKAYTDSEVTIQSISVNGTQETIINKNVDITMPTKISDLQNDNNTVQDANYVHTDNNYTTAEKTKLASLENYDDTEIKADISQLDTDKADKTELPTTLAELSDDSTHRVVTDTQISGWNAKAEISDIPDVSSFITKDVNNLTYYTLAVDTGHSIDLTIDSSTYVLTSSLKNSAGTVLNSKTVDLPLETMVVGGSYDSTNKKIILTLKNGNTIEFSVADLVSGLQSEITSSNKLDSDLVDDTSSTNKFVTASEKSTWNGKQDQLTAGTNIDITNNVISATDTTYTAGTGIDITNGVISNTLTSAVWGNIEGTLSNQTDLNTALGNKLETSKVKSSVSTTSGDVYDVTYINSTLGDIETILTRLTTGGGVS